MLNLQSRASDLAEAMHKALLTPLLLIRLFAGRRASAGSGKHSLVVGSVVIFSAKLTRGTTLRCHRAQSEASQLPRAQSCMTVPPCLLRAFRVRPVTVTAPARPARAASAGQRTRPSSPASPAQTPSGPSAQPSRRRDCHSADALSPSLLIHLLKVEGVQQNDSLVNG